MYTKIRFCYSKLMNTLESKIEAILERNKRVEAEKAWEQSFTRRLFLFLVTYITAMLIFWSLEAPLPALQAIVPSPRFHSLHAFASLDQEAVDEATRTKESCASPYC